MFPSWIRSRNDMPRPMYFFAIDTTSRRFASVRLWRASSPFWMSSSARRRSARCSSASSSISVLRFFTRTSRISWPSMTSSPSRSAPSAGPWIFAYCGRMRIALRRIDERDRLVDEHLRLGRDLFAVRLGLERIAQLEQTIGEPAQLLAALGVTERARERLHREARRLVDELARTAERHA